jgi:hypothetical protein
MADKLTTHDRIMQLEKEREASRQKLKDLESQLRSEAEKSDISNFQNKFSSNTSRMEEQLKNDTVGLVTLDEFTKRKNEIIEEEKKKVLASQSVKKKPKRSLQTSVLSFADELEEEEIIPKKKTKLEEYVISNMYNIESEKKGIVKNPFIDTSFLPDKVKEERERNERKMLQQQYLEEQERIKEEEIEVTYSYWDGTGHRKVSRMEFY